MDLDSLMGAFGPMQQKMQEAEAKRADELIEGTAGGGAVRVRIRGNLAMDGVTIAPAAAAAVGDDPSMLEDLIQAAFSDALRQYHSRYGSTAQEQLQKLMGDSDLGGLGSLLGGLL
ncbi:MAG: YbaB/EbfC family nucleoid-associated protein [Planctomycetota bacterium]|jgi:DNA-binding protein YbaB|nr:YbaB/EbfC family nucleoid-associated protein [Planctomycetota bacterium]